MNILGNYNSINQIKIFKIYDGDDPIKLKSLKN
jgi:hypothetical protein